MATAKHTVPSSICAGLSLGVDGGTGETLSGALSGTMSLAERERARESEREQTKDRERAHVTEAEGRVGREKERENVNQNQIELRARMRECSAYIHAYTERRGKEREGWGGKGGVEGEKTSTPAERSVCVVVSGPRTGTTAAAGAASFWLRFTGLLFSFASTI